MPLSSAVQATSMGLGTDRGRENADLIRFENPGKEVPRSTNVFDVPNNPSWVEVIPSVPKGRVYKIIDVDISNIDTIQHNVRMRFLNNGTVYYPSRYTAVPANGGMRLTHMLIGIFAGNTDFWDISAYFMSEGDSLEVQHQLVKAVNDPTVVVSYLDMLGGSA